MTFPLIKPAPTGGAIFDTKDLCRSPTNQTTPPTTPNRPRIEALPQLCHSKRTFSPDHGLDDGLDHGMSPGSRSPPKSNKHHKRPQAGAHQRPRLPAWLTRQRRHEHQEASSTGGMVERKNALRRANPPKQALAGPADRRQRHNGRSTESHRGGLHHAELKSFLL